MDPEDLAIIPAAETVWRIGFRPDPWAWSGWEWAANGRFRGLWDDLHGNFRTIYAGSSLKACLLEVLAGFRADARLAAELDEIVEDDEDARSCTQHCLRGKFRANGSTPEPRSTRSTVRELLRRHASKTVSAQSAVALASGRSSFPAGHQGS